MPQALPKSTGATHVAEAEFDGGSVTGDAASALLRWEGEGGLLLLSSSNSVGRPLCGSEAQIAWAESIRVRVNDEFNRVRTSLRSIADRQQPVKRSETEAILAILEDKRAEVLNRDQAGYFIHDWQEISDQVRQMIAKDSRYKAIKAKKSGSDS